MRWLNSGIFLVLFLSLGTFAAPILPAAEEDSFRLPKSVVPLSYDISLTTNVHNGARAFTGNVKINVEIKEATEKITLHNRGLVPRSVTVKKTVGGADVDVGQSADAGKEFLIIVSAGEPFQPEDLYTIDIDFTGQLQLGTSGFYRSSYTFDNSTR